MEVTIKIDDERVGRWLKDLRGKAFCQGRNPPTDEELLSWQVQSLLDEWAYSEMARVARREFSTLTEKK